MLILSTMYMVITYSEGGGSGDAELNSKVRVLVLC